MANVYNKPIVVVGGGGGGATAPVDHGPIYNGKYRVRYFDLDGTVLKIEYVADGGTITPPQAPEYDPDYLIFDEWNYDTANYIVEQPTDIGATYKTVDDATYLFIRLTDNIGLTIPTLQISGVTSIDWGDGTIDTNLTHTYTKYGEYIIKISGMTSITSNIFSSASSLYTYCLQKCYLSNGVTVIGSSAFYNCYSLTSISIPKSVASIGSSAFYNCYVLTNISIPKNVTAISNNTFNICYSLTSISIPKSVASIGNSAFYNCYVLTSISIPKSVASIGNSAFYNCTSLMNYIFICEPVPELLRQNAFGYMNVSAIMWIKDELINAYKEASNWSAFATYMKPLSWYPSLTDPNA